MSNKRDPSMEAKTSYTQALAVYESVGDDLRQASTLLGLARERPESAVQSRRSRGIVHPSAGNLREDRG